MPQKNYKYRIQELLHKLPLDDYRKALRVIPTELGIHENTFINYRKIRLGDKQDIPGEVVAKLEALFAIEPGELRNYTINLRPFSEVEENLDELAEKFNLTKA